MGELIEVEFIDNEGEACLALFDNYESFIKFISDPLPPMLSKIGRLQEIKDAITKQYPKHLLAPVAKGGGRGKADVIVNFERLLPRCQEPSLMSHNVIMNIGPSHLPHPHLHMLNMRKPS